MCGLGNVIVIMPRLIAFQSCSKLGVQNRKKEAKKQKLQYQFFSKPIPILFSIPKIFETDTDTIKNKWKSFETEKFRNWNVTLCCAAPACLAALPSLYSAETKSNLDSTVLRITRHTPQCRAGSCAATVLYRCSTRCRLFHCLIYLLGARSHTINRSLLLSMPPGCQIMNVATCSIFSSSFIAEGASARY